MSKITLNPVGSLINATTAQTNIDNNFDIIQTAMDNTLSRDGTAPNQMEDVLDMNSNQIINLPDPTSLSSPVRLQDIANLATGGTINVSSLPVGGNTGQVLSKTSGTDFDAGWTTPHYIPAGGLSGQLLGKNSGTDYDTTWVSASTLSAGGATNSIQYNSGAGFGGLTLTNGQVLSGVTGSLPTATLPSMVDVVKAFAIDNTGSTNVGSALQTAITTILSGHSVVYIPDGIYNMGSLSLSLPDYAVVVCHPNAKLRRTSDPTYSDYTASMVYWTGTGVTWHGGILENTTVLATSTTSNTINTSNKTFTTQAGLPLVAGSSFVRIWSSSHPEARFEQTVSSYSGTTLTINSPFAAGSGTYTDWNIGFGHVYQTSMCLHGATRSTIDRVRITGNWYVGMILDGWNPPAGGPLNCQLNTLQDILVEGVQNRGIYFYGTVNDNIVRGCSVSGVNIFAGATDYCYNLNPANASGSFNAQLRNKFIGCRADSPYAHGFGIGDQNAYTILDGCTVNSSTTDGIALFYANGLSPQYCKIHNCLVNNCSTGYNIVGVLNSQVTGCMAVANVFGFVIGPSTVQSQFVHLGDCAALGNSNTGFVVQGNSARCDISDLIAISNTSFGINIGSGSSITVVNGRANSNGTNFADSGTGTVSSLTTA